MRRARTVLAAALLAGATVAGVSLVLAGSRPMPVASAPAASGDGQCQGSAGADAGAKVVIGPVKYINRDITVRNVVFDGRHEDDLVRVYGGHVVFIDVTFLGEGTSSSGHSLEVKRGGSVEVYNSNWAGAPAEDSVQFAGHDDSLIKCSVFAATPGEDHIDIKPSDGAVLDIIGNEFRTSVPGAGVQNKGAGGTQNFIGNTITADSVFYERGSGVIKDNTMARLDIYGAHELSVTGNTVGYIKHGEWGSDRVPVDVTYRRNRVGEFEFNGGTCAASDNTGAADFQPCGST